VGDVTGDGLADVVVGAGAGGGSRARIYNTFGTVIREIKAYTTTTSAPVRVAIRDIDGIPEIFTAQSNNGTSRQIRGFNALTGALVDAFLESDPAFVGGINLG